MDLVAFRLANYETPLWSVENFAAGRFNDPFSGFTQYLSLHPLTPWAELLRNEDRRTRERALLMRYPLWALRLSLKQRPVELRFDNADEFGLRPVDLIRDDHRPCRELARRTIFADRLTLSNPGEQKSHLLDCESQLLAPSRIVVAERRLGAQRGTL